MRQQGNSLFSFLLLPSVVIAFKPQSRLGPHSAWSCTYKGKETVLLLQSYPLEDRFLLWRNVLDPYKRSEMGNWGKREKLAWQWASLGINTVWLFIEYFVVQHWTIVCPGDKATMTQWWWWREVLCLHEWRGSMLSSGTCYSGIQGEARGVPLPVLPCAAQEVQADAPWLPLVHMPSVGSIGKKTPSSLSSSPGQRLP